LQEAPRMSDVAYVALAYGVTYSALLGFTLYLIRRRRRAVQRLEETLTRSGGRA
jgi:CcmD family protein